MNRARFKFFRYFFLRMAYRFVYTFLVVIFLNRYYRYSTNLLILINTYEELRNITLACFYEQK